MDDWLGGNQVFRGERGIPSRDSHGAVSNEELHVVPGNEEAPGKRTIPKCDAVAFPLNFEGDFLICVQFAVGVSSHIFFWFSKLDRSLLRALA